MNLSRLSVFKGGTAFNSLLQDFQAHFPHATYIVPITDDGGSSREIARVFGGPSIGDLRSTLTRLSDDTTLEGSSVKKLLEHRLPNDSKAALKEWHDLIEDQHPLYAQISSKFKGLIRCFLCKFETKRLHHIAYQFDMRNGSIGNFFFSGARMTLGSLETAIFVYSSVAQIPQSTRVLPIIDCNDRLGIGATLRNKDSVIGQHLISHPDEDGFVDKFSYDSLQAPIEELFYVDKFKNLIHPQPLPEVIHQLKETNAVIYGMGSLWTSIIPSLIVEGIGETIAKLSCSKILIINCCADRETEGMNCLDYIQTITRALNRFGKLSNPIQAYVTDIFFVEGCSIALEEEILLNLGIRIHKIPAHAHLSLKLQNKLHPVYSPSALIEKLKKCI